MSAWPILGESAVNFHVEKQTPWKRSYTARGPHRNVLIAVTSTTSNKKVHFSELFQQSYGRSRKFTTSYTLCYCNLVWRPKAIQINNSCVIENLVTIHFFYPWTSKILFSFQLPTTAVWLLNTCTKNAPSLSCILLNKTWFMRHNLILPKLMHLSLKPRLAANVIIGKFWRVLVRKEWIANEVSIVSWF